MAIKARKTLFTLTLCAIALTGCRQDIGEPEDVGFLSIVPIADMNSTLLLSPISGESTYAADGTIELKLDNLSSQVIAFAANFGVRGFIYDVGLEKWVEVPNRIEYLSTMERVLGFQR